MGDVANVILARRFLERRRRQRLLAVYRRDAAIVRQIRDASNPFLMLEAKFIGRYRLRPHMATRLIEEVTPYMRAPIRSTGVPIHLKVLTALHFFGHGSNQKSVGSDHVVPLSQSTVSTALQEVVTAMNTPNILRANIHFPDTPAERRAIIQRNFERSNVPGVLGYVDGTHVYIVAPSVHEEQYVNRHQTHSMNVQVTADAKMLIMNVIARHPGSSNDAFIWSTSAIRARMEALYRGGERCWLLGDSGYPHEPWLHVPISDAPAGSREANFTMAHMIDRSVVERTIGHLKNRFRCLHKHRVLEYEPQKAGKIVNACVCLHNKCVKANLPPPESDEDDDEVDHPQPILQGRARDRLLHEAREVRQVLVQRVPPLPPRQPFNPRRRHRRQ